MYIELQLDSTMFGNNNHELVATKHRRVELVVAKHRRVELQLREGSIKGALKRKSNFPAYFFEFCTPFQYSNLIGQQNVIVKA